jgi:LysM repeat protein
MNDSNLKEKEKKAFWIGLGTIVAAACIIIGVVSLIFSNSNDDSQPVKVENQMKETKQTQPVQEEGKQKEEEATASQPEESSLDEKPQETPGTYEVQSGDTLSAIGAKFNVDWRDILEANGLEEDAVLIPGDELTIPER